MQIPHLRRKWPVILGAVILLPMVLMLASEPLLLGLGDFLIVRDNLQPADLIHILGGSFERLDYGVSLYKQGYGRKLFITGGDDAVKYKQYAIAQGAEAADIQPTISWSNSTYEEALELKELLDKEPSIRSVIVASSPYHMRRVQLIFEKVLDHQVRLQFTPVPFEKSDYAPQWWMSMKLIKNIGSEYLKLAYYQIRY